VVEPGHGRIVGLQEGTGFGQPLESLRIDSLENPDRVVAGLVPEEFIDLSEEVPGLSVPTPREVLGEPGQTLDAFGERGNLVGCRHRSVDQLLVLDTVGLVDRNPLPPSIIGRVFLVIAFEPIHLALSFEGEDVCRDAVEEPPIVTNHDDTPTEP
jgi:hypothetical protein